MDIFSTMALFRISVTKEDIFILTCRFFKSSFIYHFKDIQSTNYSNHIFSICFRNTSLSQVLVDWFKTTNRLLTTTETILSQILKHIGFCSMLPGGQHFNDKSLTVWILHCLLHKSIHVLREDTGSCIRHTLTRYCRVLVAYFFMSSGVVIWAMVSGWLEKTCRNVTMCCSKRHNTFINFTNT